MIDHIKSNSEVKIKLCKKGHGEFHGSYCKTCHSINVKKYKTKNAEIIKGRNLLYRTKNAEKIKKAKATIYANDPAKSLEILSAWRKLNPEKNRDIAAKWREKNPGKSRIYSHNRRSKQRENGGNLSKDIAEKLFKLQKGKCACCKKPLGEKYHLDHITPIFRGGPNTDDNIQLLTPMCNQQKQAKDPIDYMQSKGFLL